MNSHSFAGVRRLFAYSILLASTLYLVLFQFFSGVMSQSREPWTRFDDFRREIEAASTGQKNVQLHFGDPPASADSEAMTFAHAYFLAEYLSYPRQVFIGSDQDIINFPYQLLKADHLPPLDWLHAHHVSSVYIFYGGVLIPHLRALGVP